MPAQSTRITLVNDVNFLLYTPFLPEAAAGMLEPRHVVTPLRDVLKQTRLRLGRGDRPRRRAPHRHDARPGGRRARAAATTGWWSRTARSRGCCRSPGSSEHAVGFKTLADAIWLRNHVIQCLEMADATDDAAAARGAAHVRLRRRRLRRARGARRAAGLRRRGDEVLPARAPARDALDAGRGDGPRAARDRQLAGRLRAARAARAAASTSGSGRRSRRSRPTRCAHLDRRDDPDAHGASGRPASSRTRAAEPRACRSTSAGGSSSTSTCGSRARTTSGRSATAAAVPDPAQARAGPARRPPSTRSARARPAGRNVAASLGVGQPGPFTLQDAGAVREPRPLQGGRQGGPVSSCAASRPGGWRAPTT